MFCPLVLIVMLTSPVIFRSGPDRYQIWQEWMALPVISVAPVRRPKLDATGEKYSFSQEKDLMKEKIRTSLRIAVYYKHSDICLGAFGVGPGFRNPAHEVAIMWKDILFNEAEFKGKNRFFVVNLDLPRYRSLQQRRVCNRGQRF